MHALKKWHDRLDYTESPTPPVPSLPLTGCVITCGDIHTNSACSANTTHPPGHASRYGMVWSASVNRLCRSFLGYLSAKIFDSLCSDDTSAPYLSVAHIIACIRTTSVRLFPLVACILVHQLKQTSCSPQSLLLKRHIQISEYALAHTQESMHLTHTMSLFPAVCLFLFLSSSTNRSGEKFRSVPLQQTRESCTS